MLLPMSGIKLHDCAMEDISTVRARNPKVNERQFCSLRSQSKLTLIMFVWSVVIVFLASLHGIEGSCQWIYREAFCFSACEPGAAVPVFQLASNVLDPSCVSPVVQVSNKSIP
jgi:hypothetical protein